MKNTNTEDLFKQLINNLMAEDFNALAEVVEDAKAEYLRKA